MRPKGSPQDKLKSNEKPHDRRVAAKSAMRFYGGLYGYRYS